MNDKSASSPSTVDDNDFQSTATLRPRKKSKTVDHLPIVEPGRASLFQDPLNLKAGTEAKMVGLKHYGLNPSTYRLRQEAVDDSTRTLTPDLGHKVSIETLEATARSKTMTNPFYLLFLGNLAAFKVMSYYLITLETMLTCLLTVGLTLYWYFSYKDDEEWHGGGMDFILLAFAVTSPISAAIGMAYQRRERALIAISDFRSFSYHLYLAHAVWDWTPGGRAATTVDWLEHCDAVLAQLIGMGDELARFLSLPTTSRGRHRMTKKGRKEASRTTEVAYLLLESITTQRMTRLLLYSERLKKIGLPSGEVSRIRQFERFLSDIVEQLRMVKMYRSPQALRAFARIFTLLLPPFYAPTFAQVAIEVDSLGVGVAFGIITALGLTALFESLQVLEDPFTAFLALDGIDVREEFEVLHFAQLINTRKLAFPQASPYPPSRRAALTNRSKVVSLGIPPPQMHHRTKSDATIVSEKIPVGGTGSTTSGHAPSIQEADNEQDDENVTDQKFPTQKLEQSDPSPDEELAGDLLLFSVDDMVHVDEELGLALESDHEASLARDSHFLLSGDESDSLVGVGTLSSNRPSRHPSRGSQKSFSRLFAAS